MYIRCVRVYVGLNLRVGYLTTGTFTSPGWENVGTKLSLVFKLARNGAMRLVGKGIRVMYTLDHPMRSLQGRKKSRDGTFPRAPYKKAQCGCVLCALGFDFAA